jgi:hypothetical protein
MITLEESGADRVRPVGADSQAKGAVAEPSADWKDSCMGLLSVDRESAGDGERMREPVFVTTEARLPDMTPDSAEIDECPWGLVGVSE